MRYSRNLDSQNIFGRARQVSYFKQANIFYMEGQSALIERMTSIVKAYAEATITEEVKDVLRAFFRFSKNRADELEAMEFDDKDTQCRARLDSSFVDWENF